MNSSAVQLANADLVGAKQAELAAEKGEKIEEAPQPKKEG
jgi:hypothetical protein